MSKQHRDFNVRFYCPLTDPLVQKIQFVQYGKSQVKRCELRVASNELKASKYEQKFKSSGLNKQVQICK